MNLLVVGLNHKSAPVEIREKLAFSKSSITIALSQFSHRFPLTEVVILSTCNRVEIYVAESDNSVKDEDVYDFLADFHGLEKSKFVEHWYHYTGSDAINHLFQVTSSLDSMVLGESQIIAQVKDAYAVAKKEECTDKVLNKLFQHALTVAKTIHTDSTIGQGKVSISSVAVEFAKRIFQDFDDKIVFIVGAGEMCELVLKSLCAQGIKTVMVTNRSYEKAESLANEYGGSAIKYDLLNEYLPKADIVISSTASPHYVITPDDVKEGIKARRGNPMFLIDIAVPRDIDPEVGKMNNVYLYNIDDIHSVVNKNIGEREKELEECRIIIENEVKHFIVWLEETKIAPVVAQLRKQFHGVGEEELGRLKPKLKNVDDDDWNQVVYAMERTINKLLHQPAKVGKQEAKNGGGYKYVEIIKKLFGVKGIDA
ncbi:MAG: glutamyl-tRNA reductase [Candidatus Anammoxibacter sp.]